MASEGIEKVDELFGERQQETMSPEDAIAVLGDVIRKAAADESLSTDEVKAMMSRGYHLAKRIETWADDENAESIGVPVELFAQLKKDAEGGSVSTATISSAMTEIQKRISGEPEPTNKSADEPVAWGVDLASGDAEVEDWGADPAGVR